MAAMALWKVMGRSVMKKLMYILTACLLLLCAPAFAANKVVAVMGVDNVSGSYYGKSAASTLQSQLETALVQNGRYDVVERGQLNYVLNELGLQRSGLIAASTAVQLGQLTGADYTVVGKVLSAEVQPFDVLLYAGMKGIVKVNVKFIDNRTGTIKFAQVVKGTDTITEFETQSPNEALLISGALNDACDKIIGLIRSADPVTGMVADANKDEVYIDLGLDDGVEIGDKYLVYREGRVIRHPRTGEILTVEEEEVGLLRVRDVGSNYAICDILKRWDDIEKGDMVRRGR